MSSKIYCNQENLHMSTTRSTQRVALLSVLVLLGSLLAPSPGLATLCSLDEVPGATLLLPYFEVDWQNPGGTNTVFTVNNAKPEPALVHVTMYTDWSQPTITFDIFLTGYDVAVFSLFDMFQGSLPVTADAQNDPNDTISPHGMNPSWDGSFPNCEFIFPFPDPVILGANLERLRDGHTGQDVLGLGCMGSDQADGIARGYITLDSVSQCSLIFPHEDGYFIDGGLGVANNDNKLWGSYRIFDTSAGTGFGDNLVSIEAADDFDDQATATGYTFWGRYTTAGADNREPLPTVWAAEYGRNSEVSTELLVWRDSTSAAIEEFYTCGGSGPTALPLEETEVVAFDQEENAVELCFAGDGSMISRRPPIPDSGACLGLETQRLSLEGDLGPPYEAGWMALNLNYFDANGGDDVDFGSAGNIAQSHVTVVETSAGSRQVGYAATVLASACDDSSPKIADTGVINDFRGPIFADGFETGDTTAWQ